MSDSDLSKQAQFQRLLGYLLGNEASWIVDIGLKAGLFRAIADFPDGIDEAALAERLGYAPKYVRVWCRAAYAFELLDWDDVAGYRLAPHLDAVLLEPSDPQFLGGRMQFYTALYEDYRAFPSYLKSGEVWPRSAHDPWLLEALQNMSKPDAAMIARDVLPQAPVAMARLDNGGKLLDIGAGGGYHVVHYATRFPKARVVGLEFDGPSVDLARRTVADAGLAERVEIRHGDANALDESEVYDVVTLSIALHETGGPAEYRNVLARVHRALRPGGVVVVSEIPYPDTTTAYREAPVYRMLAGVQLHETLVGCGAITQGELPELLKGAGFRNVRAADQPIAARFVVLGER